MAYGIIEYDINGLPKCEICGEHFNRVLSHVRQKHHMNEREYKKTYGFDTKKGICSKESAQLSRDRVFEHYDKCIDKNLGVKGAKTRFKKGSSCRTKEFVSEQTRRRLVSHFTSEKMNEIRTGNGFKVGKSGKGNVARWGPFPAATPEEIYTLTLANITVSL